MNHAQLSRRALLLSGACLMTGPRVEAAGWMSLFDGRTLAGWRKSGNAVWRVEAGSIVGRQGPGETPGDLFTEKEWKDFDLETEWKMHWPGNSGVWFRYRNPKSAYQADIIDEPGYPGVLSGSLYCSGKAFIAENRDPASVNKNGWNKLRIRAAGKHIEIWQNTRKVVDTHDATFPGPGRIGVQVHPGKKFAGMEIHIRRIRLRALHS